MGRVVPAAAGPRPGVLSDLQQRVALIFSALPEAEPFVLAGGAALIVRGDVDRLTRDLDFFGLAPGDVDRVVPVLEAALRAADMTCDRRQFAPGFARLVVSDGREQTEVDVAADARLLPVEASRYGPVLSAEELAVDKVLAIFGRAEPRDFVDLAALEPRFGLEHLCKLAAEKDRGFQPEILREMLGRFDRRPRDEFDVDPIAFDRVRADVDRWRHELERLGRRVDRPDSGLGLGL